MANDLIQKYDGTPTTVIATTGTIATDIFSVASTNATITEWDNSSDLWPMAVATLAVPDTWAAAPDANSVINLYMCRQDISSTNDETAPTTTDKQGAKLVGSFSIYATDGAQYQQITLSVMGVKKAKFYIENKTGQTLSFSAGLTVTVEGLTVTPSV